MKSFSPSPPGRGWPQAGGGSSEPHSAHTLAVNSINAQESYSVLYLSAILTVAALGYLGYAMIRPERF
jgi:K+-transporting ATPase KdpF subunit